MLDATQRHLLLVKIALLVLTVHLVKTALHVKIVHLVKIVHIVILVKIVARAVIEILAHEPGNDMIDLIEETEVLDA
jgi:hypothetical protein